MGIVIIPTAHPMGIRLVQHFIIGTPDVACCISLYLLKGALHECLFHRCRDEASRNCVLPKVTSWRDQDSNPGKPEQKLMLWLPLLGSMVVPGTTSSGLPVPNA